MIEQMTRYSFILLRGDKENFLTTLQSLGVVDVTRSSRPVDGKSGEMLSKADSYRKAIEALKAVDYKGNPDEAEIVAAKSVPEGDPAAATFATKEKLAALKSGISENGKETEARKPWGIFDAAALNNLTELGYKIRYYKVPVEVFDEGWKELYPLCLVNKDGDNVYFVTVSDDSGYSLPVAETVAPKGTWQESAEEGEALKAETIAAHGALLGLKELIPEMQATYEQQLSELDMYLAHQASENAADDHICVFEGFTPDEKAAEVEAELDKMDVFYLKDSAAVVDNPPIKLKNNKYVNLYEMLTNMYGYPAYNEFDPTPLMSIFFLLFFAFCMGDFGYGLLIFIGGLLMKKVASFKDFSPLVTILGAATIVVGFIFHTFFSMDIATWACVPEGLNKIFLPSKIMDYDGTMVLAIVVGIIHLCIAYILKAVYASKQKGFINSLGVWGWTLLIVGGVIVLGLSLINVLNSNITKIVIIVIGILSALGIFILNDVHRNPLINVGAGLWETYNTVTGLLSDTLSYLRLYALCLAGSMLGQAFNTIGSMIRGDGGIVNWIFFIIIILLGHTLNIAMAGLGAFVHPLRLNFLEFFKNSGYTGSGRKYRPLVKAENKQ